MNVEAGRLRHRVQLMALQELRDESTGALVESWAPFATVWAAINPLSGREYVVAAAEQSEVTGRMTIRHREGIDAKMRVVHRDKIYNIKAVLPDPDSGLEYLTLIVGDGVRYQGETIQSQTVLLDGGSP